MDLAFCLKVPLDSLLVWASSRGSGETAQMRRLAWTFAARKGDKYQIRLTWPKCSQQLVRNSKIIQLDETIQQELVTEHGSQSWGSHNWASSPENLSSGFATREDSIWPAQLQGLAKVLKFRLHQVEVSYYPGSEQQQRWSDCAGWSAPLFFAYDINKFSHDVAQFVSCVSY